MKNDKNDHSIIKLILFTLVLTVTLLASGLNAPLGDPIYLFLKRMETRGIITHYNDSALPLKRDDIASFLITIQQNRDHLNGIEKKLLNELIADYRMELTENHHQYLQEGETIQAPFFNKGGLKKCFKDIFSKRDGVEEKHLFTFEEENNFTWIDLEEQVRFEGKNNQYRRLESDKILIRGGLGKNITFHMNAFRFRKTWNPDFTDTLYEQRGVWGMYQPDSLYTFDNTYSSIAFHHKFFDIGIYRQPVLWGNSFHNNLALSNNSPAFSYIGLSSKFKGINFTYIHATLLNDSASVEGASKEVRNQQKYFAGHRVDVSLFKGTTNIGLTDIVIYGDRNTELSYLIPVNFFWTIGHNLCDRDNSLLSIDFKTTFLKNFTFYGSVLIDELRFGELGKKWWANKHILQGGIRWSTYAVSLPVDIQAEFTAARPWTYTHETITTNYTNNALCLGFPYGPNSQLLFLRGDTYFSRRSRLSIEFHNLKHGIDEPGKVWGGDPTTSYSQRDATYNHSTKWLMGKIKTTQRVKVEASYEIFNETFLLFSFDFYSNKIDGKRKEDFFTNIGIKINI